MKQVNVYRVHFAEFVERGSLYDFIHHNELDVNWYLQGKHCIIALFPTVGHLSHTNEPDKAVTVDPVTGMHHVCCYKHFILSSRLKVQGC